MVPIFISESDFRERIRARKAGKLKDWKPNPQRTVTQVPKALTDWIAKNEERSKGWKTLPYFVRDNRKKYRHVAGKHLHRRRTEVYESKKHS